MEVAWYQHDAFDSQCSFRAQRCERLTESLTASVCCSYRIVVCWRSGQCVVTTPHHGVTVTPSAGSDYSTLGSLEHRFGGAVEGMRAVGGGYTEVIRCDGTHIERTQFDVRHVLLISTEGYVQGLRRGTVCIAWSRMRAPIG